MSAQNSLIKPSFTKSVMGYNTGEVDKYVEHVSDRYNSVCRENAELKRRLLSESVRIREAEERISELESAALTGIALDKGALVKIFDSLNAEKERFTYFIESLKESLNDICTKEADDAFIADDSWEGTLGGYIEEISSAEISDCASDEDDGFYEITEDADSFAEETDEVLASFVCTPEEDRTTDEAFAAGALAYPAVDSASDEVEASENGGVSADTSKEEEEEEEEEETDTRTPAQIAADLDFYTDGDHADGESFDPMTLAAQITSRSSRPKLDDFMKTLPSNEN